VRGESLYAEFLDAAGPGLHHICVEKLSVEDFDAALADADDNGAPVVAQGVMPGGMRFAYVTAAAAGVPYVEIAYFPDEIKAFFEYVKQEQK
jgi:catechol 2,3-dioxygenase-like lactoylglutathione lyase family enzyme